VPVERCVCEKNRIRETQIGQEKQWKPVDGKLPMEKSAIKNSGGIKAWCYCLFPLVTVACVKT
jgi:hypothetical protein